MLEYGLIAGASSGVEGLFSAAIAGARLGADRLISLVSDHPLAAIAVLAVLLGLFVVRRR